VLIIDKAKHNKKNQMLTQPIEYVSTTPIASIQLRGSFASFCGGRGTVGKSEVKKDAMATMWMD
jgi:hypothetical protein